MKKYLVLIVSLLLVLSFFTMMACGEIATTTVDKNNSTSNSNDNKNDSTNNSTSDNNNNSSNNSNDNDNDDDTTNTSKVKTFLDYASDITGKEITTSDDLPIYFIVGDDDSYCTIDTNPFDFDDFNLDVALQYIEKMNEALGLPDYLYNDMLHTSYSQGKQEESFKNFKVKYYYHPDKGLNVTYYRLA